MAELREAVRGRQHPDPTIVLLGRLAQSLSAAGEMDGELALSYVVFPTEAMLEAVADATSTPERR